jgi:hypothetical protein
MKHHHELKRPGDRAGVKRDHSPIVNQTDEALDGCYVLGDCETCDDEDVDVSLVMFLGLALYRCKRCQREE